MGELRFSIMNTDSSVKLISECVGSNKRIGNEATWLKKHLTNAVQAHVIRITITITIMTREYDPNLDLPR